MNYYIIDTNVPLKAATHPSDEIDRKCSYECLRFIKKLMNSSVDVAVIDTQGEILQEYLKYLTDGSQDTVATEFFKWILQNRYSSNKVSVYSITKTAENTYSEFPDSASLNGFDLSDRKFVALSVAHPKHPPICNGSDTDWWDYRGALEKEGIHVKFLCEEYMIAKAKA